MSAARDLLPTVLEERAPAAAAGPPLVAGEQRDLLCALAYVALGVGDGTQAVALLDLVLREAPDDVGALRLLAYAHVTAGDGEEALATLDHLGVEDGEEPSAPLVLLRSQALRLAGRLDEGRASFKRFVEIRNTGGTHR